MKAAMEVEDVRRIATPAVESVSARSSGGARFVSFLSFWNVSSRTIMSSAGEERGDEWKVVS